MGAPNLSRHGGLYRSVVAHATLWNLWFERNRRTFEEVFLTKGEVWNRIIEDVCDCVFGEVEARSEDLVCN